MRHRVFIAINLPADIQKKTAQLVRGLSQSDWDVRWVREGNFHMTLRFLGYLNDEEASDVIDVTKGVAQNHRTFQITLNGLLFLPDESRPRVIGIPIVKSQELTLLVDELGAQLEASGIGKREDRRFRGHVTLGRVRKQGSERRLFKEIKFEDIVDVPSIEIMESELGEKGSHYSVLAKCSLASNI